MRRLSTIRHFSNAQARSEIKRINQRIVQAAKTFGKDSETYRAMVAPLMSDKYAGYIGESKSGYVKINADVRKAMKDDGFLELLYTAQGSVKTITRLKETARRKIQQDRGPDYNPTNEEIIDTIERRKYYEKEMSKVEEFIYNRLTEAEAEEMFPELYRGQNGDTLSYDVLDSIIERTNEQKKNLIDVVDLI